MPDLRKAAQAEGDGMNKIWIIQVAGVIGGQWYCAVLNANTEDEARRKADKVYAYVTDWYKYPDTTTTPPTEVAFDTDVSSLWWVGW